jgi:hypothetical protein
MDPTWNDLVAACNQISFTSTSTSKVIAGVTYDGTNKQGGSGIPTILATNLGYAQILSLGLNSVFQQFYATYPYTGSYIVTQAVIATNVITFTTIWNQPASGYAFEPVDISAGGVTTLTQYPPEQTYISNTWGTITLGSSVV